MPQRGITLHHLAMRWVDGVLRFMGCAVLFHWEIACAETERKGIPYLQCTITRSLGQ